MGRGELGDSAGLAAVARQVFEQIADRVESERARGLRRLGRVDLQRPGETGGAWVSDGRISELHILERD